MTNPTVPPLFQRLATLITDVADLLRSVWPLGPRDEQTPTLYDRLTAVETALSGLPAYLAATQQLLEDISGNAANASGRLTSLDLSLRAALTSGTISLNVPEQLNAIRELLNGTAEASYQPLIADVRDSVDLLRVSQQRTVTTGNGPETFTLADLIYALGVCQCEGFLGVLPPPPPLDLPQCVETGTDPTYAFETLQLGAAAALTGVTFNFSTYDAYVHPLTDTQVFSALGKAYAANPQTQGRAFFPLRDRTLGWVQLSDILYWGDTTPDTNLAHVLVIQWPVQAANPTATQLQNAVDLSTLSSFNVDGGDLCGPLPTLEDDTDTDDPLFAGYAVLSLWQPGFGPGTQPEGQLAAVRVLGPPGSA